MALDLPPKIFSAPEIGILRAAEPWEKQAHAKLLELGVPREVRRAVVAELRRLEGVRPAIIRPALDDLSKYAKINEALLPGLGIPFGGKNPKLLTFQTSASDAVSGATHTYTAQAIGSPTADRVIFVVCAGVNVASAPTAATVAGNAMTLIKAQAGGSSACGIFAIQLASGATATIAVTFAGSQLQASIGVWSATGLSSVTAFNTQSSTAANPVGTLSTLLGGFAIGVASSNQSGGTVAWTNATLRFNQPTTNMGSGGADALTTGVNLTITATPSASAGAAGCFASW